VRSPSRTFRRWWCRRKWAADVGALTPTFLHQAQRPDRRHFEILAYAWAGWVFDFYDLMLFSFLLIPLGREFGFSKLDLSWVLGASLGATAVGGVIFGALADRFGRRSVLQWTILTYSIGTFLCGLAPGFAWLMAFRVVTGLGVGGEWATGQAYVSESFPPNVRGRYSAYMQTGAPVGVALAAVMGGFLAPEIGWRACFLISAMPAVLVIAMRRRLPESDLWLANRLPSRSGTFAPLLTGAHRGAFLRCLILTTFTMSSYWFTYSWLPGYLFDQRHMSMARSASWILVTQSGGFLGYLSFGFVADRWGRRPAFTVYSVVFAVGLAMITVFFNSIGSAPALLLAFMFLVGLGTGVWSGFGPLFAELFPTAIRNTAMGAAYNIARGVQFFTPVVITLIARRFGLAGGMSVAAFFAVATAAWIWTFEETKGKVLA
jgi:MFS family permease